MMPPHATKKTLTDAQKNLLKQWVAKGAEYQSHWSLIAPGRSKPPAVKNAGWARNPVDQFILAKLDDAGLAPAPEADRRTLARRLSLDLTGLPPEPAVVEAFVNDKAPDAYEKLVDGFLNSSAWGDIAQYWLDARRLCRHGIPSTTSVRSDPSAIGPSALFNKNQPFDQFTIEQLAGDLLPTDA